MSRSKRAAREREILAPGEREKWLRTPEGGVRAGWLLAVSLLSYTLVRLAALLGLTPGFAALFRAWGVNSATVARAPGWARLLWRWQGSVVTLTVSAALIAVCRWLRRLWLGKWERQRLEGGRLALFALAGLGMAVIVLLLGLLPDSLRLEMAAPRFSWSLIAVCAVSLLSALAEEAFTKGVLFDGLAPRWGKAWAAAVACAWFFLGNGGYAGTAVSALNVLLMGFLCCVLYARYGLWAAVGLRWGWSFATVFLMGFGGGETAVYRFYGVSETLLTGGDAGPIYGLWTTLLLVGMIGWMERNRLRAMRLKRG
ncbi:MAG: CPBP family intramembrane metalloprotease [Clostridia bacterium]|nr:CPBP family intramembrane metalloprotease [Clostridia bacterium]